MKLKAVTFLSLALVLRGSWIKCEDAAGKKAGIPRNQYVPIYFERFDEKQGVIWLRLHNYTAWDIRVPCEISWPQIIQEAGNRKGKDGIEVPVRYYLEPYDPRPFLQIVDSSGKKSPPDEPDHPPVPSVQRVDFLTEWPIKKKQSILFRVPKEHLARNVRLYVYLRYEWEQAGTESLDGPVHLAYFRGIDLPPEVQAKIK